MAFPLVKIVASAFVDILLFLSVSFPIAAWCLGIAARLFFLFACVVIREEDIGKRTTVRTMQGSEYEELKIICNNNNNNNSSSNLPCE